jgi:hypothetical protein
MPTLIERKREIEQKQAEAENFIKDHKTAEGLDLDDAGITELNRRNDELTKLGEAYEAAREAELTLNQTREKMRGLAVPTTRPGQEGAGGGEGDDAAMRAFAHATGLAGHFGNDMLQRLGYYAHPNGTGLINSGGRSLGEHFVESERFKEAKQKGLLRKSNPDFDVEIENVQMLAVMTTTAGFPPFVQRQPGVLFSSQRKPLVATLIPQDATTESAVLYVEETLFTNNAAPVAENAAKPESALEFTEQSIPLQVIATHIPVTNQQLEDVPTLRGIIDNRLTLMLMLAEENQLLNGNGTSPQLMGFYNKPGTLSDARAVGTNGPDFVFMGMTRIRTTTYEADITGVIFNPLDWQMFRMMKTTQGNYIWGNPSEVGPERLWGLDIVQTMAATRGKVLLGDFQLYSHISRRHGIRIDVADQHDQDFAYNRLRIRAEERVSLEIIRPPAFWIGTGVDTWDGSPFPTV